MKLIIKFNLILLAVFIVGLAIASLVSFKVTKENAYLQVKDQATLLMEQAIAVRSYTVNEVRPLLNNSGHKEFLPQTVPAYSATQVFNKVREKHPAFSYKEAVLNPTNTRNKAVGWEKELVKRFIDSPDLKEQEGEIIKDNAKLFYFAFPIAIKNPKCLACHSNPAAAPTPMLALYGTENGFDWKQDEIVGAQVVTVPLSLPLELAQRTFQNFVISMFAIFLALFVALNILMNKMIIRPITRITETADIVSHGNLNVKAMKVTGKDEISSLSESFNRMMRSTAMMAKMLREQQ